MSKDDAVRKVLEKFPDLAKVLSLSVGESYRVVIRETIVREEFLGDQASKSITEKVTQRTLSIL